MADQIWTDCTTFCTRYLCQILIGLTITLTGSASAGVVWIVSDSRGTGETLASTTATLGQHMETERRMMDTLERLNQSAAEIKSDISVIKYRLDTAQNRD